MWLSVFRHGLIAFALGGGAFDVAYAQSANSVVIWPIKPVIESGARTTTLRLENSGKRTTLMQIRIFGWEQADGKDRYFEQKEIMGTPPMVRIEPGQKQLVRLTRITPSLAGQEQAYRIVIDEIPLPDNSSSAEVSPAMKEPDVLPGASIRFRMRYSLPLFTYGAGAAPVSSQPAVSPAPALRWRVLMVDKSRVLEIHNDGNRHGRLNNISVNRVGGTLSKLDNVQGYVLANTTMRWPIAQTIAPEATLVAMLDGDEQVLLKPWR